MDSSATPSRKPLSLTTFLRTHNLFDVWHCRHANERDYSFYSDRHCTYGRIDLYLVDRWLLQKNSQTKMNSITWSDHASVLITIGDKHPTNNAYVWCSNSQIIQNQITKHILEDHLSEYFQINSTSEVNPFMFWNAYKAYIHGIFIQQGAGLKRQRQQQVDALLSEISSLETQNKAKSTPLLHTKLLNPQHELKLILLQNYEQKDRRMKLSFYSTSIKAGKALACKLQGQRFKTRIPHLINPTTNRKEIHPQKIADSFSEYYESLYRLNMMDLPPNHPGLI